MTRPRHQRRAAFHEAGHAVAYFVLLGDVGSVEIHDDGTGHACRPDAESLLNHDWREYVEAELVITMAGPMAEARMAKVSASECWIGQNDMKAWREWHAVLTKMHCANDRRHDWRRYERDTRAFLSKHWALITRLALALEDRQELDADDVRAILTSESTAVAA